MKRQEEEKEWGREEDMCGREDTVWLQHKMGRIGDKEWSGLGNSHEVGS